MAKTALNKSAQPGTMSGLKSTDIEAALQPYRIAIANALPNGDSPDRIIQMAAFMIATTPELASCTEKSIVGCILNASILGLNPALKQCHFIPRKNRQTGKTEACFQFDYRGMISLARRSGLVSDISAEVVRKSDTFEVHYGTSRRIEHIPNLEDESEDFSAVYAVITYTNGGQEFVVMTPAQVQKRRAVAGEKNPKYDFWERWTAEMWKKTALHSLLNTAPLTEQTTAAFRSDGLAMSPDNFNRGKLRPETIIEIPIKEDGTEDIADDAELNQIREGLELCNDDDAIAMFWEQNKTEWQSRPEVVQLFAEKCDTVLGLEKFWAANKDAFQKNAAIVEAITIRKNEIQNA